MAIHRSSALFVHASLSLEQRSIRALTRLAVSQSFGAARAADFDILSVCAGLVALQCVSMSAPAGCVPIATSVPDAATPPDGNNSRYLIARGAYDAIWDFDAILPSCRRRRASLRKTTRSVSILRTVRNPFNRRAPTNGATDAKEGERVTDVLRQNGTPPEEQLEHLPAELLWLLDAPLFIDSKQVEAFYDAILRPDYEQTSTTLFGGITTATSFGGKATVGAALPWFKAQAEMSVAETNTTQGGRDVTLTPISNAYRHLVALALHYATQPGYSQRLVIADPLHDRVHDAKGISLATTWLTPEYIRSAPRAIVFLDVPPGGKFIPAALELSNGEVRLLADELGRELGGLLAEKYPKSPASPAEEYKYYQWFSDNFDDRTALAVVERNVKDHQVAWAAYNVPLSQAGPTFMHLHMAGRGQYETGAFAYNFIVRGFKYGLRIVGTLKSGPDLNVLAVFEG